VWIVRKDAHFTLASVDIRQIMLVVCIKDLVFLGDLLTSHARESRQIDLKTDYFFAL
jgi:hypothetical protein